MTPADYRDTIGSMLEEVNRLTDLVDSLLTISRADAGAIRLDSSAIFVIEIARGRRPLARLIEEKWSAQNHRWR